MAVEIFVFHRDDRLFKRIRYILQRDHDLILTAQAFNDFAVDIIDHAGLGYLKSRQLQAESAAHHYKNQDV